MMIGGGGSSCVGADHGNGITKTDIVSLSFLKKCNNTIRKKKIK